MAARRRRGLSHRQPVNHPNLTRLGWSSVVYQITRSRSVINNVTGYRQIRYLRPPYGAWNRTVLSAASYAGYRSLVLWDVDSRDWARPSLTTLVYTRRAAGTARWS